MDKKVYAIYFYTNIFDGSDVNVHPYVYFSEVEAKENAKLELDTYGQNFKYKILELKIYESNSVNFIRREDL